MLDITYRITADGYSFWPESDHGRGALNELAVQLGLMDLAGYTVHPRIAKRAIADLRRYKYTVRKAEAMRISDKQADALLAELLA